MSTVCIFSALFLPNLGGVERFTESLSAQLVADGHSVIVVTNNTHGLADMETLDSGVEVLRFPCLNCLGGRYPVPIKNTRYRRLLDYLKSIKVDGVLVNTRFYLHSLIGVRYAEHKGLRAVVLDHGSAYLTLGSKVADWLIERYEDGITKKLSKRDVSFYGISNKSAEWLRHFGVCAKGVIHNAIDSQAFRGCASGRSFRKELSIPADHLLLSYVGRLVPEKGVDLLVRVFKTLPLDRVSLVVAGDGPLCSTLLRSGVDNLHMVGALERCDVASLLIETDVLCLLSRSEGFCTSLLESSACGTPFISTDVGGAQELAADRFFSILEDDDIAGGFRNRVLRILDGEVSLDYLGGRGVHIVDDQFKWEDSAAAVLNSLGLDASYDA